MRDRHVERNLTWGQIHYCFEPWEKIHFHFMNMNKVTFADTLGGDNDDARISSIYVGKDDELHITFFDDYKGYQDLNRKEIPRG